MTLGKIRFDVIDSNLHPHNRRTNKQEEYDIVLTNGKAVAIVEVKQKAHTDDIQRLARKVKNYTMFYPGFANYTIYGALAGMSVPDDVAKEALSKGFFVLRAKGNHMEALKR